MTNKVLIENGLKSEEMEKFKSEFNQRDLKKGAYFIYNTPRI